MKGTLKDSISDTQQLADIITSCNSQTIEPLLPLLQVIAGETINRFIFMDKMTGKVTLLNESLGMWEDGIWYSNDYHKKTCDTDIYPHYGQAKYEYTYNPITRRYDRILRDTKSLDSNNVNKIENNKHIFDYTYEDDDNIYDMDYIDATYDDGEEENALVFVYGTLKRGYNNHTRILANSTYLGKAITKQKWLMVGDSAAFPYLLEQDDTCFRVEGEVYSVDADTKRKLDALEGVPNHYKEETIEIMYSDTKEVQTVQVYTKAHITEYDRTKKPIKNWVA